MIMIRRGGLGLRLGSSSSLLSRLLATRSISNNGTCPGSFYPLPRYPKEQKPMPEPDGGRLVDLVARESERVDLRAEAAALPALAVGPVDLEWALVLADGWASPLSGFMRQFEYLQSLHFGSLMIKNSNDGSTTTVNMSIPITLAITADDKRTIEQAMGPSQARHVTLLKPDGEPFAILRSTEIYRYNKEERIIRTWGTSGLQSPYVKEVITPAGDWLIGGDLQVLEPIKFKDGLDHYRLSPRQLRKEFVRLEADAVFAFQLRGPFHNGHALYINNVREYLLKMGYKNPILLLHPLGGFTEPRGLPLAVLMEQYCKVLEDGVLNPATSVLAIFPSPMNYLGQAEVLWHAKARINVGANFYIIDDIPITNKTTNMFCVEHGTIIFNSAAGLDKIHGYPYWEALYDTANKKMVEPSLERPDELISISEAEMQRFAINGDSPPQGFMCPSWWKLVADHYRKSSKIEERAIMPA